jgi:hypothetical protein
MEFLSRFAILILLTFSTAAEARRIPRLTFEPVFGMESAMVRYPEPPRMTSRAVYGGRMLYGITPISLEAEYLRAMSRQDYVSPQMRVEDNVERASLGIRSTAPLSRFFAPYLRAGARASRGTTSVTTASGSTNYEHPQVIDPYAGTGIQLGLSQFLALNAGFTLFRIAPDKYETQYTLGISLRFGTI